MNYTLNQLRIFVKVAQTESVTKASEELHLTQPAVSIQLKNFQDQFEIPLFEYVGRKIYMTDFGREIAQSAEEILNQVYAINYKTMSYKGNLTGRLRISVVSTGKYVMPYFIADFIRANPGVELEMDVTNKARVVESIQKNEVDYALVSLLPESHSISKIELIQNKLFLVGNTEMSKKLKAVTPKQVRELPLIYREKGSGTRQTMETYLDRINAVSANKLELTSNEAVKQSVIAGLGFSILPLIGIKNELELGQLKIIPVRGLPIKTSWNLIWHSSKKLSPVAAAYLSYLREQRNDIIEKHFDWYEKY